MTRKLAVISLLSISANLAFAQASPGNSEEVLARKMQGGLHQAFQDARGGKALKDTAGTRNAHSVRDGKLQVILAVKDFSDDLRKAVNAAGCDLAGEYDLPLGIKHVVIRATSAAQLENLVLRDDVKEAAPEPKRVTRTGAVSSQGDASFRGPLARSTYGFDGTGIRVGVISDTFSRTIGGTSLTSFGSGTVTGSTPQLTNDLPSSIRIVDAGPIAGATDEGAGMAEIVHDVAPGASISFASAYGSYSAFATNITALRTDPGFPCKIIVDDVGYFSEPLFQNGLIGVAANQAAAAGVPYFSALGNDYNDAHEADYTDTNATNDTASAFTPTGVDFHDFGVAKGAATDKFLTFNLGVGYTLTTVLRWDEPGAGIYAAGPGASSDLNLYITSSTTLPLGAGNILGKSIDVQGTVGSPAGEPYEAIDYTNNTGSSRVVHVCVDHLQGRNPVHLHLWAFTDGPYSQYTDRALDSDRTAYGHPCANNAMGVAAVRYKEVDTNGSDQAPTGVINVESYSSLAGNLPFLISDNGLTRYASAQYVFKPDFTAPDGGNTTFFGSDDDDVDTFPNFYGTSAAAPHAAGVAALMLQAKPSLTPANVYSILKSTAKDIAAVGVDSYAGSGLIDAKDAVAGAVAFTLPTAANDWALFQ